MPDTAGASRALITAAVAGLLCVATPACSSQSDGQRAAIPDASGAAGADGSAATPTFDAAVACEGGPDAAAITSTTVAAMSIETMMAECDARGGMMEVYPHCGGFNTCRGLSYDSGTQTLTEHTCRGANTCAGFGCVICG